MLNSKKLVFLPAGNITFNLVFSNRDGRTGDRSGKALLSLSNLQYVQGFNTLSSNWRANMKVSAIQDDWSEVINCGLENQQIDFKAPQNWNTIGRVGRAKFARHAIAMANTAGGYVVIGVGEDENGNPTRHIGMSVDEASSFDPSTVGQTLASYADPPVSIDVVRPVVNGLQYVVLVIYPFKEMPHVCSNGCEHELQAGAFYIRTPDARSKVALKASELHLLINRALRNQRQMLGRMLRGILYEDKQTDAPDQEIFQSLVQRSRQLAREKIGRKTLRVRPYFELICTPQKMFSNVSITELRQAADSMERPAMDDLPLGNAIGKSEVFATNESIRGTQYIQDKPVAMWEMYQSGLLYVAALFPEHQGQDLCINARDLAQVVFGGISAIGQFFTLINHADALLDICVRIPYSNEVRLEGIPGGEHICRILDVEVSKQRTAGDLESGAAPDTAAHVYAEICERFNVSFDRAAIAEIKLQFSKFY